MTDTEINIAIAESLGWTDIKEFFNDNFDHPNDYRDEIRGLSPFGCRREIHDYTASLDACAEFEAKLKENGAKWVTYCNTLALLCGGLRTDDGGSFVSHMTAIDAPPNQRCEAYLRTLGEWKESNQQPE